MAAKSKRRKATEPGSRPARPGGSQAKVFKRKSCLVWKDKTREVDCKNVEQLRRYTSERGKIRSRRMSGACRTHQRQIAVAIKRAREMAAPVRGGGRPGALALTLRRAPLSRLYHGSANEEANMESLNEALRERLVELSGSSEGRQPLLATTGTQAAIAELIARSDRLEKAIGEIALEVETLAAAQKGGVSTRGVTPASDR